MIEQVLCSDAILLPVFVSGLAIGALIIHAIVRLGRR